METNGLTPIPGTLTALLDEQPYPHLFVTVSGAHLYGFASPNSDYDLRGVHVLPAREIFGLLPPRETIEVSRKDIVPEADVVTHDARKFFSLLLTRNGYVLEQLCSPLVVRTSGEHAELKAHVPGIVTRFHANHYLGFAETQWRLFLKDRRVKPLLYIYRVLLTGIHLMQSGEVEANITVLNEHFRLPFIADLVAAKAGGTENVKAAGIDPSFHEGQFVALRTRLEEARENSHLPAEPSAQPAINDLLVRIRMKTTEERRR